MNSNFFLGVFAVAGSVAFAQAPQNALAFDKVDDYVSVANASNLIAGKTTMSLTAWVYPTNANPGWPAFDGILGIRNDANADFYMLQLSGTQYELRFRNSSGTPYTITSPSVSLNEWQHLALVYDGSTLKFYKNGSLQSSISATGSISTTGLPLNMGRLPFSSSTTFYYSGRLDDVALWGSALSASDVLCLTADDVDPAASGLLAYYPFNAGVAGGANSSITQLAAATGSTPAVISNMSMSGSNSNLVAGVGDWGYLTGAVCSGSSFSLGGQTFSTPGSYLVAVSTATSCDSVVELVLSADSVNFSVSATPVACKGRATGTATAAPIGTGPFTYAWNTVPVQTSATATGLAAGSYQCTVTNATGCSATQTVTVTEPATGLDPVATWNNGSLTVTHNGGTSTLYQWVSCPNFTALANQTNPAFSPLQNGTYAVIVTDGACSDTSDCVTVSNIGMNESLIRRIKVHPNPARDKVHVAGLPAHTAVQVFLIHGPLVATMVTDDRGSLEWSVRDWPAGCYLLHANAQGVGRLVVTH
ncbi:MAG: hypothetical protein FJX93_06525 [Bacteroidetes bacterium]|nr:hypothetical protein [Bacteroidota bacterium]